MSVRHRLEPTGRPAPRGAGAASLRDAERRGPSRAAPWLAAGALAAVTLVAYSGVWRHDFVSFDDTVYVTANPHVLGGLGRHALAWAFTTADANFWHPLTWLSLMLDVRLWGPNSGSLHVTNLVLHIGSTLLLFAFLVRATGHADPATPAIAGTATPEPGRRPPAGHVSAVGRSAFVAALFAVHPLHVESVAWVAERKDVLSTFFWMLTLCTYVWYLANRRPWRYAVMLATFALGLLAKPMLVTLPFALLLLDVWPLRRLSERRDAGDGAREGGWAPLVVEKAPLIALAAVAGVVAFYAQQQGGAVAGFSAFPLANRAANALVAYATYVLKMMWPSGLVPFYPYPPLIPFWRAVGSLVALAAVSIVAVRLISRRPYLAVGWFWYIGTLLPVAGLVQVGSHSMADRYTYVPLVGLFIVAAWGGFDLFGARRRALPVAACSIIVACVAVTRAQVATWRDSATLWEHSLAVMPDNFFAHAALADVRAGQGRIDEAIAHYGAALDRMPSVAEWHNSLGVLLMRQGRVAAAAEQYSAAIRLQPDLSEPHNNMGAILARQGRLPDAVTEYSRAIRLKPGYARAHCNLGVALASLGRGDEAIRECLEAVRLEPRSPEWHYQTAAVFNGRGDIAHAVEHLRVALQLDPDYLPARRALQGAGETVVPQERR
jgi:protein O-mannosyl-transferase